MADKDDFTSSTTPPTATGASASTAGTNQGTNTSSAQSDVSPYRDEAKSHFSAALDEAKAGATALKDEAMTRANTYRDQARNKGDDWSADAKVKSRDIATEGKAKASGALTGLSRMVDENASAIDENFGPKYGDYARNASRSIKETADTLDQKSVDELSEDVRTFVREKPGAAVGIAAVAGFFLARMFRK